MSFAKTTDEGTFAEIHERYDYAGLNGRISTKQVDFKTVAANAYLPEYGYVLSYGYAASHGYLTEEKVVRTGSSIVEQINSTYSHGVLATKKYMNAGGVEDLTYHPSGAIATIGYTNGTTTTYSPESNTTRLGQISVSGNLWNSGPYSYDGAGNVKAIGSDIFQYDALSRLVTATVYHDANNPPQTPDPKPVSFSYSYDELGNMEARTITNEGTLSWITNADTRNRFINEVNISATYPSSPTENGTFKSNKIGLLKRNTVDQAGFGNVADGYDANGNVLKDGVNTITYDSRNYTGAVKKNDTNILEKYIYDSSGERVASITTEGGLLTAATYYLRSGSQVFAEEAMAFLPTGEMSTADLKEYLYVGSNLASTKSFASAGVTGHSISGAVKLADGTGLGGVTVILTGAVLADPISTTTSAEGFYLFPYRENGAYSVHAEMDGYEISPTSRSITVSDNDATVNDFTAEEIAPGTRTVSGKITLDTTDGEPLSLVKVSATALNFSYTGDDGNYIIEGLSGGKSYDITPSRDGYVFNPSYIRVKASTNQTGINFIASRQDLFSISGKVNYFQGGLGNVTVRVSCTSNPAFPSHTGLTDDGGYYSFGRIFPAGTYTVTASIDSSWSFEPEFTTPVVITNKDVEDIDFTAMGSYNVSGSVLNDCTGDGISGIPVGIYPGFQLTFTGEDGSFSFGGCGNRVYTIYFPPVAGWSYGDEMTHEVTVSGGNKDAGDFTIFPLLTGMVTRNGRMLADVDVVLFKMNQSGGWDQVGTDSTSQSSRTTAYSFGNLSNGTYKIVPSHPDYYFIPADITVDFECLPVSNQNFQAFPSGYYVSGTLEFMDRDWKIGYSGYKVTVTNNGTILDPSPKIYEDGWYEAVGLDSGSVTVAISLVNPSPLNLLCRNFDPEGYPRDNETLSLDQAQPFREGLDFNIFCGDVGYDATGRITTDGNGLGAVKVNVWPVDEYGNKITTTIYYSFTSSDGYYTVANLPNGDYMAEPELYGYDFEPEWKVFIISQGNVDGLNFTATMLPRYKIEGYVYAESGPLEGVKVILGSEWQYTDVSGYYVYDDLVAGDYRLAAEKSGYNISPEYQDVTITASDRTDINFTAQLITYSVSGAVTIATGNTGTPDGVLVTAQKLSNGAWVTTATGETDESGSFILDGFLPCTPPPLNPSACQMRITPSKPGYTFTPPYATVSVTDQDVTNVSFTAKYDPCTISGTVTFKSGSTSYPLRGVTVTATSGAEVRTAVTDAAGLYILGAFAKRNGARAAVVPFLTGYQFSPTFKSIQLNKTTQSGVDFTAKFPQNNVTYRIEGYITAMRDGTAIEGATVQLIEDGTLRTTTTTASDGWYQFTGLATGDTFTVAPVYPCEYGFNPSQTEVTIAGADATEVNFTARRLTYAIYGVVTGAGDVPLSGVVVNLKDRIAGSGNLIASTTTDSSGRYQFVNLENGLYSVRTEENCFPSTGLDTVAVFCENKEVNFECRIFSETERSEEKKSILRELNRLRGIDNKGRQADNGDMETTADKGSASAISPQASSRTEASVPVYYFYHWDHLGTTRLITNSSGNTVSRHDYEPFGVEIPPYPTGDNDPVKNTHQYTGHERDAFTGMDYMHARFYGSSMGRFMRPDPVGGNPGNPQSWNLYAYVDNNPIIYTDPTGKKKRAEFLTTGLESDWVKHSAIRIYDDENPSAPDIVYSHGGKAAGRNTTKEYLDTYNPANDPTTAYPLNYDEAAVSQLESNLEAQFPKGQDSGYSDLFWNCAQFSFSNIRGASDSSGSTQSLSLPTTPSGHTTSILFTNQALAMLVAYGFIDMNLAYSLNQKESEESDTSGETEAKLPQPTTGTEEEKKSGGS